MCAQFCDYNTVLTTNTSVVIILLWNFYYEFMLYTYTLTCMPEIILTRRASDEHCVATRCIHHGCSGSSRLVCSMLARHWFHMLGALSCYIFFMSFRVCTHPRYMWEWVHILFAWRLLDTNYKVDGIAIVSLFIFHVFLEILIELKLIDLTRRRRFKVSHLQYGRWAGLWIGTGEILCSRSCLRPGAFTSTRNRLSRL